MPRDPDRTGRWREQACGHLHGRRLAGSVGAEQRHHLAAVHDEVDAVQHLDAAVGGMHPDQLEGRHLGLDVDVDDVGDGLGAVPGHHHPTPSGVPR
jgi:hypothetical protein